ALSQLAAAGFVVISLFGGWTICAWRGAAGRPRNLRERAAQVPLSLWYVGAYLSALLLLSGVGQDARYLLPVLPILIALAAAGLSHRWHYAIPAAAAIALYYAALLKTEHTWQPDQIATCGPCMEMYAFVQTHTSPDAVVAFVRPRAMALFSGRSSWRWSND